MASTLQPPVVEQIIAVLEKVPLFEGLSRKDLENIAKLVRGRTVKPGELLFKEGDAGDKFYIVQSGAVEILKEKANSGGESDRLAIRRTGDAFGEMALLSDAPRSATARAIEQSNLVVVSREQFDELLGGDTLATRIMRSLAKSLRALNVRFGARDSGGGNTNQITDYNRSVQKSLLPNEMPQASGFDLAAAIACDAGGHAQALWDSFPFGGGVLFAVLDANGPSLPPAHLLAVARSLLREIAAHETSFERLLPRLNSAVQRNMVQGADAYIEVGLVHIIGDVVSFAIAGDQPALVLRKDGSAEEVTQHGPSLGIMAGYEYGTSRADLKQGDYAIMLSQSNEGLLLGIADLIRKRNDDSAGTTAAVLHAALMRAQDYRKGDDISFVIARKM